MSAEERQLQVAIEAAMERRLGMSAAKREAMSELIYTGHCRYCGARWEGKLKLAPSKCAACGKPDD